MGNRPFLAGLMSMLAPRGQSGVDTVANAIMQGSPSVTNWSRETPGTLSDVSQSLVEKYGSVLNSPAMSYAMGYRDPRSL